MPAHAAVSLWQAHIYDVSQKVVGNIYKWICKKRGEKRKKREKLSEELEENALLQRGDILCMLVCLFLPLDSHWHTKPRWGGRLRCQKYNWHSYRNCSGFCLSLQGRLHTKIDTPKYPKA